MEEAREQGLPGSDDARKLRSMKGQLAMNLAATVLAVAGMIYQGQWQSELIDGWGALHPLHRLLIDLRWALVVLPVAAAAGTVVALKSRKALKPALVLSYLLMATTLGLMAAQAFLLHSLLTDRGH